MLAFAKCDCKINKYQILQQKSMETNIYPGKPYPLGATLDDQGVNFAIFSENATGVELCLFNASDDQTASAKFALTEVTHNVWHIHLSGIKAGQLYGYRINGPYEPENGHRFNSNKLLIDPYAKAISGTINWDNSLFGYIIGDENEDLSFSETDSAPFVPKSVVIDNTFDWEDDVAPNFPMHETIIYETHVKGFTKLNTNLPEEIRGTYKALGHPASISYFKELGVTSIELLPVHHFVNDGFLQEKGLSNYWGYNTINFFSPDVRYSVNGVLGEQVTEFKNMVKELHKAGLEVILDVVYNHTAEGNHLGPTLSFKGIDNFNYYRLVEDDLRFYMDYTGTGNTLNARMPAVLRLIMDSLRYWITEMHVDGFRFDLASTLARELHAVDKLSSFFDIIHQDPIISQVKLIAEPWDVGEGGYQVGKFPNEWAEWNGKFRDCVRDYWIGADSILGEFAERFTGSSDLYKDYRTPWASVNFITAHDGFTLHDLVSYNEKHNEANLDDNQDGETHNRSWNCGVEGETDDENIISLRNQQKRNFLATLFLSQGVPMLVAGDEFGRTQKGNNNGYCQDNEISWLNWAEKDTELHDFTKKLIAIRKAHPSLCRKKWFQGQPIKGRGLTDIAWFLPEGDEMDDEHWNHDFARSLAIFLNGNGLRTHDENGNKIIDDDFYFMFNAYHEAIIYHLPPANYSEKWVKILDTANPALTEEHYNASAVVQVSGRSVVLLKGIR